MHRIRSSVIAHVPMPCLITYFSIVRSCVTLRIGPGIEEESVVIFLNISITPSVPISFTDLLFWIIQT